MRRAALLLALLLPACSGSGVVKVKDPGPVPSTSTTAAVDFGAIGLKGVTSRTTSTVALGPGNASITGNVTGPDGGVAGATVRVERLVGTSIGTMDVTTQPDGTFAVPTILGGRYRVRAWHAPDLAQVKPEVFYLQSSEPRTLALRVDRYDAGQATASIAPNPPQVHEPANLFVLYASTVVDAQGVVRATPVPGASLQLLGNGVQLDSANPVTSDNNGIAQWRIRCTTTGPVNLSVAVVGGSSYPLVSLPQCVEEGYVPPTAPPTTFKSRPSSTTSSTRRRGA